METTRGISPQSGRRSLAPGVAKRNPGYWARLDPEPAKRAAEMRMQVGATDRRPLRGLAASPGPDPGFRFAAPGATGHRLLRRLTVRKGFESRI